MKTRICRFLALGLAAVAMLATLGVSPSTAFAQGSLTPPGSPAATMKSLDQIEARTIVNAANTPGDGTNLFIISQPGSYYLTANVVPFHLFGGTAENGIEITANNVTLDLNGFAMQGASGNVGIYIPNAQTNITVRNGSISGWASKGVYLGSVSSLNMVFECLSVSANNSGICLTGGGVVRDCVFVTNVNYGVTCSGGIVSGCTADKNGTIGIFLSSGTLTGCSAQNNGTWGMVISTGTASGCSARANGIGGFSVTGSTVSGCSAQVNGTVGIYVSGGKVSGCQVYGNLQSGIYVDEQGTEVIGNTCSGNNTSGSSSHAGIYINDKNCRVEDNQVTTSGYAGISVSSSYSGNIIIKNSVSGNGANNYIIPAGQVVGPLITTTGTITSVNPWANFSF